MMLNWNELEAQCLSCQKCALADKRTNVVFGVGPRDAEVMFIGEGVLLIGWGGSFTLLLVALWLLAKEKEGKKGRNRSCQGLQKRVKWFLHSK